MLLTLDIGLDFERVDVFVDAAATEDVLLLLFELITSV
jgi:hypothetical protein